VLRVIGCVLTSVCLYGTELDSSKSDLGVRLTLLRDTGSMIADRHEPRVPGLEYGPILCPMSGAVEIPGEFPGAGSVVAPACGSANDA
jgi:hypothetical protein